MEPKTGSDLMALHFATTRLDAMVRPLMAYADRYATARAMASHYGNTHGDENAVVAYREDLDKALREAFTKLVRDAVQRIPSLSTCTSKDKP